MILGIDASNLRDGGGVTHIAELLNACNPAEHGFSKVIIWGGSKTLNRIAEQPWLVKQYLPILDKNLLYRMLWQRFRLSRLARTEKCSLLFTPGGSYAGSFHPMVTMSRNLLPFEWKELARYGFTFKAFKMLLLRITQSATFRGSDGLIFLTAYARQIVQNIVRINQEKVTTIPHGINSRFLESPREQLPITNFSGEKPFRILYVSVIEMYKHQWNVAEAVSILRREGIPVVLDLIGPSYPPALKKLTAKLGKLDPQANYIRYYGPVPHQELHRFYSSSQLCVFASSCENMPNILLEGMAAGLPIACSSLGPMPEVLGDAGVYFNPLSVPEIVTAIKKMMASPGLRAELAAASFNRVQEYSWKRCAAETFHFLQEIALRKQHTINQL